MKPFSTIAAFVLGLVALLHLLRFILAWEVIVSGINLPLWLSAIAFVFAAGLAVMVWREARQ